MIRGISFYRNFSGIGYGVIRYFFFSSEWKGLKIHPDKVNSQEKFPICQCVNKLVLDSIAMTQEFNYQLSCSPILASDI